MTGSGRTHFPDGFFTQISVPRGLRGLSFSTWLHPPRPLHMSWDSHRTQGSSIKKKKNLLFRIAVYLIRASLVAQLVKSLPAMQETRV